MARQRKSDWPLVVYRYRAYPVGPLPETLWQTARAMQVLWNRLVEIRNSTMEGWSAARELGLQDAMKRAVWDEFQERCQDAVAESDLNWECGPDVLERLMTAHWEAPQRRARAIALGADPSNPRLGAPRFHGRLEHVQIPHRYTGGGVPIARVYGSRARRFSIERRPPTDAYASNTGANRLRRIVPARFGLDGASIPFRLRLHRPLPEDGILKRVAWQGEFVPHERKPERRWRWHVWFMLEVPPADPPAKLGRVAALDVGWRKLDGVTRVGVLADSGGGLYELRLPDDLSTAETRYHAEPGCWEEVYGVDARLDVGVERMKALLRGLLQGVPVPDVVAGTLQHLHQAKGGALVRVMRALDAVEDPAAPVQNAVAALQAWAQEDGRLRHIRNDAVARMVGRRRWIYRNLASWLAQTYDGLAIEDLTVARMAGRKRRRKDESGEVIEETKEPGLEAGDRRRQIAAPAELLQILRTTLTRRGCRVDEQKPVDTTRECAVCGELADSSARLWLVCPNGHRWDQDVNAARNLLRRAFPEGGSCTDAPTIPPQLRGIVVPLANRRREQG